MTKTEQMLDCHGCPIQGIKPIKEQISEQISALAKKLFDFYFLPETKTHSYKKSVIPLSLEVEGKQIAMFDHMEELRRNLTFLIMEGIKKDALPADRLESFDAAHPDLLSIDGRSSQIYSFMLADIEKVRLIKNKMPNLAHKIWGKTWLPNYADFSIPKGADDFVKDYPVEAETIAAATIAYELRDFNSPNSHRMIEQLYEWYPQLYESSLIKVHHDLIYGKYDKDIKKCDFYRNLDLLKSEKISPTVQKDLSDLWTAAKAQLFYIKDPSYMVVGDHQYLYE